MAMNRNDYREDTSTDCQHETAETLGSNNDTYFLRCLTCRSVVVSQGDRRLAIPPVKISIAGRLPG